MAPAVRLVSDKGDDAAVLLVHEPSLLRYLTMRGRRPGHEAQLAGGRSSRPTLDPFSTQSGALTTSESTCGCPGCPNRPDVAQRQLTRKTRFVVVDVETTNAKAAVGSTGRTSLRLCTGRWIRVTARRISAAFLSKEKRRPSDHSAGLRQELIGDLRVTPESRTEPSQWCIRTQTS